MADSRAHETPAQEPESPLGAARAQLHETYIIAQTRDGLVIVDQHAAHERIVYEKLKRQREETGVARQMLLIPAVVELDESRMNALAPALDELAAFGLALETFRPRRHARARDPGAARRGRLQASRGGHRRSSWRRKATRADCRAGSITCSPPAPAIIPCGPAGGFPRPR